MKIYSPTTFAIGICFLVIATLGLGGTLISLAFAVFDHLNDDEITVAYACPSCSSFVFLLIGGLCVRSAFTKPVP